MRVLAMAMIHIAALMACVPAIPVSLSVDTVITPEALDLIDPERPLELTLEVTLFSESAASPPSVFTVTDTHSSEEFSLRLAILEQVSSCAVTGDGSTARLLFGEESVADYAIVLSEDETTTDWSSGRRCAYNGVIRDLSVVPAADGVSLRFEEDARSD